MDILSLPPPPSISFDISISIPNEFCASEQSLPLSIVSLMYKTESEVYDLQDT